MLADGKGLISTQINTLSNCLPLLQYSGLLNERIGTDEKNGKIKDPPCQKWSKPLFVLVWNVQIFLSLKTKVLFLFETCAKKWANCQGKGGGGGQRKVPSMTKSDITVTNMPSQQKCPLFVNKSALSVQESTLSVKKVPFQTKKCPLSPKEMPFQYSVTCPSEDWPCLPFGPSGTDVHEGPEMNFANFHHNCWGKKSNDRSHMDL